MSLLLRVVKRGPIQFIPKVDQQGLAVGLSTNEIID